MGRARSVELVMAKDRTLDILLEEIKELRSDIKAMQKDIHALQIRWATVGGIKLSLMAMAGFVGFVIAQAKHYIIR